MVSHYFKIKKHNVYVGFETFSQISDSCINKGDFSIEDQYSASIISRDTIKVRKKIYKSIHNYLEELYLHDNDNFISHYYNSSYYGESAQINISFFLNGVSSIYKNLFITPGSNEMLYYPYGKMFHLCYKANKKHNVEIKIDVDKLACFWGNLNYFYIHFENGLSINFDRGCLVAYVDKPFCNMNPKLQ